MGKGKPRWKSLSFEDRMEKEFIKYGYKDIAKKWKENYKKRKGNSE